MGDPVSFSGVIHLDSTATNKPTSQVVIGVGE